MKKKLIAALLAAWMSVSLAACSDQEVQVEEKDAGVAVQVVEIASDNPEPLPFFERRERG